MSEALKGLSAECERLIGGMARSEPAKKKVPAQKKTPVKKKVRTKKTVVLKRKRAKKLTDTEKVLQVIRGHKKGVDIPKLVKKTGFADSKVRAIVYRAGKEGKIKRLRRGIYTSA